MFGITAFAQSPFATLGGNVYNQALSESVAPSDAQAAGIAKALDIAESIAAADTQTVIQNIGIAVSESISPVDTPSTTQIRVAFVAESIAQTDEYEQLSGKFVNMDESMAVTENYALSNNIFNAAVAEATTPSDTDSSTGLILIEEVDEVMGVVDIQAAIRVVSAAIAESLASLDDYARTQLLAASILESAAVGLIVDAANNGNSDVSESIAAVDTFIGERAYSLFISESVAPADAQAGVFNFTRSVAESIATADNITFTVNTRALPTGVLITLSVNNVNVWGNINDDSNPNWVIIQD